MVARAGAAFESGAAKSSAGATGIGQTITGASDDGMHPTASLTHPYDSTLDSLAKFAAVN